jgi:hypothetical protein
MYHYIFSCFGWFLIFLICSLIWFDPDLTGILLHFHQSTFIFFLLFFDSIIELFQQCGIFSFSFFFSYKTSFLLSVIISIYFECFLQYFDHQYDLMLSLYHQVVNFSADVSNVFIVYAHFHANLDSFSRNVSYHNKLNRDPLLYCKSNQIAG